MIRMSREEIDRAIAAVADDPLELQDLLQLQLDFAHADEESWRMLPRYYSSEAPPDA